jgi:hypothetical protein
MKITIAKYYSGEGYAFLDYDTDTMTQEDKEELAFQVFIGDAKPVELLDNSAKTLGNDIFEMVKKHVAEREAEHQRRSLAAKKAWAATKSTL